MIFEKQKSNIEPASIDYCYCIGIKSLLDISVHFVQIYIPKVPINYILMLLCMLLWQ